MEKPYNPLEKINLAESIRRAVEANPLHPLPPNPFVGAGIYAIYYGGPFKPYAPISSKEAEVPIYVGSALPGGGTGSVGLASPPRTQKLHKRLMEHAKSIEATDNLDIRDFRCRYLLLDDVWILLAENYMIGLYKPLWNSKLLRGFGIHHPGGGRKDQRRSLWDELHPGRYYAKDRPAAKVSQTEIARNVAAYFAGDVEPELLPPESAPDVEGESAGE